MRIATWNINGIKARLDGLLDWLRQDMPDIACLQEIKSVDDAFPRDEIEALGYHVETYGQKSFNGVALLARKSPDEVMRSLPVIDGQGEGDEQARFLEAVYSTKSGVVRVASLYLPNGNPVMMDEAGLPIIRDKYAYKLDWMARLHHHARQRLEFEEPFILAGDYNVIPGLQDAAHPDLWRQDALFLAQTRQKFRALLSLGLSDAVRLVSDDNLFSFWDYQAGAWQKDNGIRIDHILLSPQAADCLNGVTVQKELRGREKPSDHVPVWLDIDLEFF